MFSWFRRKKPAPAPAQPSLSLSDSWVLNQAGLTLTQWQALSDEERSELRWRIGLG